MAAGAGLSLSAALGMTATAEAADFTVQNTNDAGTGSLRAALTAANNGGGNDRILFRSGLTGTITLAGTLPTIDEPLEIVGPGASALTVSGNNAFRILYVDTNPGEDVTVSGLKLTLGAPAGGGGAINATDADLTVADALVSDNKAGFGGAIYSFNASVTILDSTLSGNQVTGGGGGGAVNANGGGPMTIERSEISGNSAAFAGGLYSFDKDTSIIGSTISGNTATAGGGGGINGSSLTTKQLAIERSTVSGNRAVFGAGIYSFDQARTIESSTISGNTATAGNGGGLNANDGALTVRNATIAGNSATGNGGGIYSFSNGTPALQNAILANNSGATGGPDLYGGGGDVFNASFSLIESTSGATITSTVASSNLTGADPKLGPLTDNGGPMPTHALQPGSPALDMGSTSKATDQRGAPRPFNFPGTPSSAAPGADGADIGAYESVLCAGQLVNRVGTAAKDTLTGTAGRDGILGLGGNDLLLGKAGGDRICGGAGGDKLRGGKGRDRLKGGKGRDRLFGQQGRDKLDGGPGRDRLLGGPGRDQLLGGPGRDLQKQ